MVLKRTLVCSLLALLLVCGGSAAGPQIRPPFPERPRLVVVLVIDQFR